MSFDLCTSQAPICTYNVKTITALKYCLKIKRYPTYRNVGKCCLQLVLFARIDLSLSAFVVSCNSSILEMTRPLTVANLINILFS